MENHPRVLTSHHHDAADSRIARHATHHNGFMTTTPTAKHEHFMARALTLAQKAVGHTAPNPMVGAVIVKGGRMVAEGYHRRAGWPHAEVEVLRRARARARGATLYVTLEPCNHTGRTPPCCKAIIAAGISRVVVGTRDPNPMTNGRGLTRLRRAGIVVVTGVLEEEANELIAPFRKVMRTGLPFLIAKIGQSVDGKIATTSGESRWITSATARRLGHQWRSRVDAILVGVNTILRDDPLLTARSGTSRHRRPLKIILDSHLRTPPSAKCLSKRSSAPTLIATTSTNPVKRASLLRRGAEVLTLPAQHGRVPLRRLCQLVARRGIHSILVEGGGEVLASALTERLVDRVLVCIAPIIIGGRTAPSAVGGEGITQLSQAIHLEGLMWRRLGPDLCVEARVVYPIVGTQGQRREARSPGRKFLETPLTPRPPGSPFTRAGAGTPLAPDLLL